MRYWGSHRYHPQTSTTDDQRGRHRKERQTVEAGYASSPTDQAAVRQRRELPRDALGRFRAADSARDAKNVLDTRNGRDRPDKSAEPSADGYTWRDFELDDDLPRALPHPPDTPAPVDGRRHCGALEAILYRQWDADAGPPSSDVVRAIDSLAALPDSLKEKLTQGLDSIYVGGGGVPELDDMEHLRGQPLPSGQATWDICAGAYGDRKVIVGDQPSPTPDVMMHEVGHALDDIDGPTGEWQSDCPEFRALYDQCLPRLASDFHRQSGDLGRHEFFADAFAAISSRQRPALVDMLGGDTRTALNVMLYFNRRYGI